MSRHRISSGSPRFDVIVGWDRPLNSYFAQVRDLEAADEDDALVVWVGASFSEIQTPESLQPYLSRYTIVPDEILTALREDRATTLDKGASELQRNMRIIAEGSKTEKD